ncbi:hypothetical protein CEK71_06135 [Methylovulum psychrotolerans]|uniref:Uncharacterized protein n=1 Tax=Methylovulum psychrotolerans TaxID=1704499 RepID=A0A1Z4BWM4_9GAMM|nr:hypothetical protein CEK71_06135 [Methylovulum psychrotolerans]
MPYWKGQLSIGLYCLLTVVIVGETRRQPVKDHRFHFSESAESTLFTLTAYPVFPIAVPLIFGAKTFAKIIMVQARMPEDKT